MRRLAHGLVGLSALTMVVTGVGAVAQASSNGHDAAMARSAAGGSTARHFALHDEAHNMAFEDLGRPSRTGPDLGDLVAFSQRVTRNGETVGQIRNSAIGVDHKRHLFQAEGTLRLPRGDVEFAGLVTQTSEFTLVVTGGSGAFLGATGTMDFRFKGHRQLLTLRLVP
jgi:hypothetical protein